ncbi:MAG: hypothetical protein IKZ87_03230 [Actinomycetaceae bacterium]|nr:hypothetical protein [Actinomycetaceae bacterium]
MSKIDEGLTMGEPVKYSKEWYIAEIQKGIDDMKAGRVVPFEQVKEEAYGQLGICGGGAQ